MGRKILCKSSHRRKRPRPQPRPFSSFAFASPPPTPHPTNTLECIISTSKEEDRQCQSERINTKNSNNMVVLSTTPIRTAVVVSVLMLLAGPSMASTPTASKHFHYRSNDLHGDGIKRKTRRIQRFRSSAPPATSASTTSTASLSAGRDLSAQHGHFEQKAKELAEIHRRAAKGAKKNGSSGSGGKGSIYAGCQVLTCDEMESAWIFPSSMPPCPGHVHKYSYEDDACEAWKSSGKGGGKGGGKGSSGNNNYSGGDSDGGNGGGDADAGGGDTSSGGGGGGAGDNDGNGDAGGDNDNRGDENDNDGGEGGVDGGGEGDATANFDITVCESYSSYWLWDLALTCNSTESLDGCDCTTAESLRDGGAVVCPEDGGSSCPTDCPVCRTCLSLLGCASLGDASSAVRLSADVAEAVPYAVAAVVAVAFVALLIYREKRRQDKIGLFVEGGGGIDGDKDPNELAEFPTSSTPYIAAPIYGETGPLVSGSGQGNNVWLAPVD